MKIMIVDADCDYVEMLSNWLKSLGYEVYGACTGERAKMEWAEHKPDLVLIDPETEDEDVSSMYGDLLHKHDALVIVVTYGKKVDESQCLESGADAYLRKPFYPSELLARIQQLQQGV